MLFRVLLRLQGLGRGVGTEVRVTELLQPYVKHMLAERYDPRRIAREVGRSVRSWDHFVAGLPDELTAILDQIRNGTLGVDFRVHDVDHAVDRLVDGLVTAATVLAGAQLISRRAGPMVGPFSVPGLVAAGVGVVTWQRLVARRRPQTPGSPAPARSPRPPDTDRTDGRRPGRGTTALGLRSRPTC